jgi:hypothetical protein
MKYEFLVPTPADQIVTGERTTKLARQALDEYQISQCKIHGYDGNWYVLVRAKTQEQCLEFEKSFRQECEKS